MQLKHKNKKIIWLMGLILLPFFVAGQNDTINQKKTDKGLFTFTPAKSIKKRQTRFRPKYLGFFNGKNFELLISEKKYANQLFLVILLKNLEKQQVFKGVIKVAVENHHLEELLLLDENGHLEVIQSLFLHKYNPNYINVISGRTKVGCFSTYGILKNKEIIKRPFLKTSDFLGEYEGRVDGRPANLSIKTHKNGYTIILEDQEHRKKYRADLESLPVGQKGVGLSNILLQPSIGGKEIRIKNLIIETKNNQMLSGSCFANGQEVGLFFIRQ